MDGAQDGVQPVVPSTYAADNAQDDDGVEAAVVPPGDTFTPAALKTTTMA
jgi:hypothetical protein